MNQNPYAHKNDNVSPRAFNAHQNNTMDMLSRIASKPPAMQPMPSPMQAAPLNTGEAMPIPMSGNSQAQGFNPDEMAAAEPFDKQGNFVLPPIKNYWLGVLEKMNAGDKSKSGPDWRDEAIENFKKISHNLDVIEEALHGGVK